MRATPDGVPVAVLLDHQGLVVEPEAVGVHDVVAGVVVEHDLEASPPWVRGI